MDGQDSSLAWRRVSLVPCVVLAVKLAVEHAVPHAAFMPCRIVWLVLFHAVPVSGTHARVVSIETM